MKHFNFIEDRLKNRMIVSIFAIFVLSIFNIWFSYGPMYGVALTSIDPDSVLHEKFPDFVYVYGEQFSTLNLAEYISEEYDISEALIIISGNENIAVSENSGVLSFSLADAEFRGIEKIKVRIDIGSYYFESHFFFAVLERLIEPTGYILKSGDNVELKQASLIALKKSMQKMAELADSGDANDIHVGWPTAYGLESGNNFFWIDIVQPGFIGIIDSNHISNVFVFSYLLSGDRSILIPAIRYGELLLAGQADGSDLDPNDLLDETIYNSDWWSEGRGGFAKGYWLNDGSIYPQFYPLSTSGNSHNDPYLEANIDPFLITSPSFAKGRSATAGEILLNLYYMTGDERYLEGYEKMLNHLLRSMYDNGGVPVKYPYLSLEYRSDDYYRHTITYHHGIMTYSFDALLKAHKVFETITGDFDPNMDPFDDNLGYPYYRAAMRIAKFTKGSIYNSEAWFNNYDPETLEPVQARSFEVPAKSLIATHRAIDILTKAYKITGDESYLAPATLGYEWIVDFQLDIGEYGEDTWALFYHEDNSPWFVASDGTEVENPDDANSIAGTASWWGTNAIKMYEHRTGNEYEYELLHGTYLEQDIFDGIYNLGTQIMSPRSDSIAELINEQNEDGAWTVSEFKDLDEESIVTRENAANSKRLIQYLYGTVNEGDPFPTDPVCGNSIIESGEQCDDGNTFSGDGCSYLCQTEEDDPVNPPPPEDPICGNSIIESGEQCDDGNTVSGDGCSYLCQTEENQATSTPNSIVDITRIQNSLIKALNDPRVYYINENNQRYYIPNFKTFKSWFNDFSSLQVVDSIILNNDYPYEGRLTVKPGRLVKFANNNKVYAIEPSKTLRWIKSGNIFKDFGYDFNKIIHLPQEDFQYYDLGDDLSSSDIHPTGQILKHGEYPQIFYIKDNIEYWIPNADTFLSLGFQWQNIVTIPVRYWYDRVLDDLTFRLKDW